LKDRTVCFRAGWQPNRHWALQLDLENGLDKNYREPGSGADAPGMNPVTGVRLEP
jgi:hypothetical protein